MSADLNLARNPFLNPRPVKRLALLLWAAGLIFAALNVRLYWSHFTGSSETREQQQALAASIEAEEARVRELRTQLAGYDLEWQNDQSAFLNSKIAERSFSWSQLFDLLGEVLPANVRVSSLSPEFSGGGRRGRSQPTGSEIEFGIRGIAKDSPVLLEFIDALFEHPSFRDPDLTNESLNDQGMIDFNLSVIYEASPAAPPEEVLAESAEEGTAEAAEPPAELATATEAPAAEPAGETEATPAADSSDTPEPDSADAARKATRR